MLAPPVPVQELVLGVLIVAVWLVEPLVRIAARLEPHVLVASVLPEREILVSLAGILTFRAALMALQLRPAVPPTPTVLTLVVLQITQMQHSVKLVATLPELRAAAVTLITLEALVVGAAPVTSSAMVTVHANQEILLDVEHKLRGH